MNAQALPKIESILDQIGTDVVKIDAYSSAVFGVRDLPRGWAREARWTIQTKAKTERVSDILDDAFATQGNNPHGSKITTNYPSLCAGDVILLSRWNSDTRSWEEPVAFGCAPFGWILLDLDRLTEWTQADPRSHWVLIAGWSRSYSRLDTYSRIW